LTGCELLAAGSVTKRAKAKGRKASLSTEPNHGITCRDWTDRNSDADPGLERGTPAALPFRSVFASSSQVDTKRRNPIGSGISV